MSKTVRIFINGTEAEVDASTLSLAIDYAVEGDQPGKVRGAHTKRAVTLPATSVNRGIFEDIQRPTAVVTDAANLLPARIEVSGLPVLNGRAQLTEATFSAQNQQPAGYKVAFYGANADWFSQIKDLRVRDLTWGSINLNRAEIETDGNNVYTDGYCTCLVKWKSWERDDSVHHIEHSVGLFIKFILSEAFKSLGYTITGDFPDTDLFERLIIPLPLRPYEMDFAEEQVNARFSLSASQVINHLAGVSETTIELDDDFTYPNFDTGGNFDTGTYTYTAPAAGYYKFTYGITFSLSSYSPDPSDEFELRLNVNGFVAAFLLVTSTGGIYYNESLWTELQPGDEVTFSLRAITVGDADITISDFYIKVDYEKRDILEDETLELAYLIPPEWLVKDVILDMVTVFGVVIDTDPAAGTIRIEPRDRYTLQERYPSEVSTTFDGYYLSSSATDKTGQVETRRQSSMQLITDLNRYYILDYYTDDETIGNLQAESGLRLYGSRYDFGANRFPAGETLVQTNFFAKTYMDYDSAIVSSASSAIPYLPIIYDADYRLDAEAADFPDDFAPRLLYFAGRRAGLDGKINLYNTGTSASSAYDYPAAFVFNQNDTGGYDPSLAFSNETTNNGIEVPGLMQRFHLQHLKRLEGGRRYTFPIRWHTMEVNDLSFRRKVFIDGAMFILEKLEAFNPLSDGITETVLLRDEIPLLADAAKVTQAVLSPVQGTGGGSGGSGGGVGSGGGGGTTVRIFEEEFPAHASATLTVTVNSGLLPSNLAQIRVMTDNGQEIKRSYWSVSGSDIILTYTPDGSQSLWVWFIYTS